jgi:Fic family protein
MNNENTTYIWQQPEWPFWQFDMHVLADSLAEVHQAQTRLIHHTEKMNASARKQAMLQFFTDDVLNTSQIEGEQLNPDTVRASIARHLGMDIDLPIPADKQIDGIVSMVVDATTNYAKPLTSERLFNWHDALFPTSYSIISTINTESWRNDATGPMKVVSGPIEKQTIHFEAPPAQRVNEEMMSFLRWFNVPTSKDPLIKAGLAHLWFLTIHPFGDGNGRIARAINDMALARSNGTSQRFYSYAAQIQREHDDYYDMLEMSQKGSLDVTKWLSWFLACLKKSIDATERVR